jgi:hypothetical protein
MVQDWLLSWLQLTSSVPAVEEKAEVVCGKFCHSLCALPMAVQMMQMTGASQRQHGPCKNIEGVYQFRN